MYLASLTIAKSILRCPIVSQVRLSSQSWGVSVLRFKGFRVSIGVGPKAGRSGETKGEKWGIVPYGFMGAGFIY
jgi:hypothetical protein